MSPPHKPHHRDDRQKKHPHQTERLDITQQSGLPLHDAVQRRQRLPARRERIGTAGLESPLSAVVTAMPGLDDVLVTGQVTAAAGYGVPDVLVEFAGTPADFYTLTDWHGVFHQSLPLGWQGVVTPVAANWTFAPEALALAATGPDLPDQDFQATARLDAPPVGDIDGDYFLTAKDLVIFRHVPSGNTVYASAAAADLDGDGVVSRQDIPLLGQKIAGNR